MLWKGKDEKMFSTIKLDLSMGTIEKYKVLQLTMQQNLRLKKALRGLRPGKLGFSAIIKKYRFYFQFYRRILHRKLKFRMIIK